MKIATWNVNSLRVRLPHLIDWLTQSDIDLLGLQETKLIDAKFPKDELQAAGYHVVFAGQPTYNGVAILAKMDRFAPPTNVVVNNPLLADQQVRLISATCTPLANKTSPADFKNAQPLRFISAYVPNGSEVGSEKFAYKMNWLSALHDWLKAELFAHPQLAIVGDYNIAPDDRDVHDPAEWHEKLHCSTPERDHFKALLNLGLQDAFRLFDQPEKIYSWWDYRQMAFRRNRGLRIDHLLLSDSLAAHCTSAGVDKAPRKLEQPSDHAPAYAVIDLVP
jgi:exodeoxyribonuclease-3